MASALSVAGDARHLPYVAPLRLLWLIDSLTTGGAESVAVAFARASRSLNVELTICARTSIGGNPLENDLRAAGFEVLNLGARNLRDRRAFRRLVNIVRERRIDVIHAHLTYAAIWGALASRVTRVPLVATLHVEPVRGVLSRDAIRQRLLTLLLNRYASRTLLVSDALRRSWGTRLRRTTVIPNGVDVAGTRAAGTGYQVPGAPPSEDPDARMPPIPDTRYLRNELGIPENALVVTSVAVLRPGKGIDVLLRAAAKVSRPAVIVIAGEGPMRDAWHDLGSRLGVPVIWTGHRRDVRRILAASDLFVLPTLGDALPTVVLEAMAEGVPVIASNVGGVPEIIDDSTGILVPPGDPATLAAAIDRALSDESWRRAAGAAGRVKVERQFSVDVWTRRLFDLYTDVAPRRLRVAVVEPAGKGGLIHYAWQLCRAMSEEGADVTLVTERHYELESLPHPFRVEPLLDLWDPKPQHDSLPSLLRRVRRAGRAIVYYREWARLIAFLRRMRLDVVQFGDIRFATDVLPIAIARRLLHGTLFADICHNVRPFSGTGSFSASSTEKRLYRGIYRRFDSIFVHYDVNAAEFRQTFPDSAAKIVPIVHGNEEIFGELAKAGSSAAALRSEMKLAPGDRVVLFFGTLSRYKGLDVLLDAFARVAPRVTNAKLVIAGFPFPDFDVEAFLATAAAMDIADRLLLIPRYIDSSEVAGWMKLADVVVFPYRDVFQSGALHVAQTFGAPIVTTRVGAMAEVIRDGESGLVVEPDSAEALARAIETLLTDRALAARLGERAAHDAVTRHSWRAIARTLLDHYEQRRRA